MFLKFPILFLISSMCIFYLKYTESTYKICNKYIKNENFKRIFEENLQKGNPNTSNSKNVYNSTSNTSSNYSSRIYNKNKLIRKYDKIKTICKEFETDYSSHFLMKYTINILNDFIYGNSEKYFYAKVDNDSNEEIDFNIMDIEINNFQYTLYSIKFIHMFFYSLVIYFVIVFLPTFFAQVILYLLNRTLYIIFVILFIEAFFKIYLSIDTDLLSAVFENSIYPIIGYAKYFIECIGYMINKI
jgi:hypothetical protein